jgi:uncharacterized membrane protein
MTDEPQQDENQVAPQKPGILAIVGSVVSAAFGVRSSKKRNQDFTHGKFRNYVIAAICFVIVFIFSVFSLVQLVLKQSG